MWIKGKIIMQLEGMLIGAANIDNSIKAPQILKIEVSSNTAIRVMNIYPNKMMSPISGRQWRTGKTGVLQSMELQRVGHNWATEQQEEIGKKGGTEMGMGLRVWCLKRL